MVQRTKALANAVSSRCNETISADRSHPHYIRKNFCSRRLRSDRAVGDEDSRHPLWVSTELNGRRPVPYSVEGHCGSVTRRERIAPSARTMHKGE